MKILLVTPSYFPIVGGSEVLTQNLLTKLNDSGIHADVMTLNMNKKWNPVWKEETVKNSLFHVLKVPALNPFPRLPNPLSNLFQVNVLPTPSAMRKLKDYDVIHFVGEADLGFPILSYFIKKPKIMHCVGIFRAGGVYKYYTVDRSYLRNIFKKFFPKLADLYLVSSFEEKELLIDLGVPENKISILNLGVDIQIFSPDETKKMSNLILFVGRIDRIKGVDILMKAISYLDYPTQVAIIGPRWEEKYSREIEQMAQAINKKGIHKVKLLGGMDQQGLVPWYQKASVLVCPYLYETFSNVIREALACGTPVVSTGTQIEEGSDGILVASKSPRAVADAIKKFLQNNALRERYGKDGRKLIEQHFSWESIISNLTSVYKDLLENDSM